MLGAALLAATAAALVLFATRPPPTTAVLVTDAPAAAGTRIDDLDLSERLVSDASGLVLASDLGAISDAVLAVDLGAGVPIVEAVLARDGSSSPDVIGVDLPASAAVHGQLVPGDRVDLHLAGEDGPLLEERVSVVSVFFEGSALGTGEVGLLLAVDEGVAPRIIDAMHGDGVHLVRVGR
jgi:Flp pilus assembly protein CpaB